LSATFFHCTVSFCGPPGEGCSFFLFSWGWVPLFPSRIPEAPVARVGVTSKNSVACGGVSFPPPMCFLIISSPSGIFSFLPFLPLNLSVTLRSAPQGWVLFRGLRGAQQIFFRGFLATFCSRETSFQDTEGRGPVPRPSFFSPAQTTTPCSHPPLLHPPHPLHAPITPPPPSSPTGPPTRPPPCPPPSSDSPPTPTTPHHPTPPPPTPTKTHQEHPSL